MNEEEIRTKWVQLQYLNEQIKALQAQLLEIEKAIDEMSILKVGLKNIKETDKGEEILIPLGASVYVRGNIKENEKVLVGMGAGVFVEKSIDEAIPLVEQQMIALQQQEQVLIENITLLNQEAQKLSEEINKAVQAGGNAGVSQAPAF